MPPSSHRLFGAVLWLASTHNATDGRTDGGSGSMDVPGARAQEAPSDARTPSAMLSLGLPAGQQLCLRENTDYSDLALELRAGVRR